MEEYHGPRTSTADHNLTAVALGQVAEVAHSYDEAVRSYNEHLENHRERRDLHNIPVRQEMITDETFQEALDGELAALKDVLSTLLDEPHLDSALRMHPRVYPIHLEAIEHLEIARRELIKSLEDAIRRLEDDSETAS